MIAEDLLLLALHDQKGSKESGIQALEYELSGELIVDLALNNKVKLKQEKLIVTDHQSTGDDLLDETKQIFANNEKDKEAKHLN